MAEGYEIGTIERLIHSPGGMGWRPPAMTHNTEVEDQWRIYNPLYHQNIQRIWRNLCMKKAGGCCCCWVCKCNLNCNAPKKADELILNGQMQNGKNVHFSDSIWKSTNSPPPRPSGLKSKRTIQIITSSMWGCVKSQGLTSVMAPIMPTDACWKVMWCICKRK